MALTEAGSLIAGTNLSPDFLMKSPPAQRKFEKYHDA
jgi:hypothetical protein